MAFTGFTKAGISFFKELAVNNQKEWFEKNRGTYEQHVLDPLKELASGLGPLLTGIDGHIDTTPQVNRAISRIYRDTRFSKDKSPLRTDAWLSFKRPAKIWGNGPEFYFYFTTDDYQYGMGYYAASAENMERFRDYMAAFPEKFRPICDRYREQSLFELVGEDYKRPLPNALPDEFQRWFQKKTFCVHYLGKIDDTFFSAQLQNDIEKAFAFHADLYRFLTESSRF
jgi:uncharacterized protein (TIGR02453 family)